MVERRDQVLMTRFSPFSFIFSIFFNKLSSQKGPFFRDLPIWHPSLLWVSSLYGALRYIDWTCSASSGSDNPGLVYPTGLQERVFQWVPCPRRRHGGDRRG